MHSRHVWQTFSLNYLILWHLKLYIYSLYRICFNRFRSFDLKSFAGQKFVFALTCRITQRSLRVQVTQSYCQRHVWRGILCVILFVVDNLLNEFILCMTEHFVIEFLIPKVIWLSSKWSRMRKTRTYHNRQLTAMATRMRKNRGVCRSLIFQTMSLTMKRRRYVDAFMSSTLFSLCYSSSSQAV